MLWLRAQGYGEPVGSRERSHQFNPAQAAMRVNAAGEQLHRLETLSEDGEEVKLHLRRAARFEVQHRAICQALGIDLQPGASKNSSTEPPKLKNCHSGVPHGDCCESRLWIRN
ncbi:MAG: hypothetical protein ACKO3C_13540 [Betaproteobacteria bacterium]